MHPFRALRNLLSRAGDDWRDAVDALFTRPARPAGPRPLRLMRLERRRVLSADFSLAGTSLLLSGFDGDGGETLAVSQRGDSYEFTTSGGWNAPADLPVGVTLSGDTLAVDSAVVEDIVVRGSIDTPLDVRLGDADFSPLSGGLTFDSPARIGQPQPFAQLTAPAEGVRIASSSAGTVVTSISVSGDLTVISFGAITDAAGTEIVVTGNATFISRVANQAGDFNADGMVDQADRDLWTAGYGTVTGASRYDGDANGDGAVDAADYTLWRDSVGQTSTGGITLADTPADRLIIGGVATFDADESQGVHPIDIGRGGQTEFGSLRAYGSQVAIFEDASAAGGPTAVIDEVEAYTFSYTAAGKITDSPTATIAAEGDATFVVTSAALIPDSTTGIAQAIELANEGAGNSLEVGGVATFVVEPQTTTDPAFDQRKGIDVGVMADGAAAAATFNAGSLRFSAPNAAVRIAEDSSTVLTGWTGFVPTTAIAAPTESVAGGLAVVSADDVTDTADMRLRMTEFIRGVGSATFVAAGEIVLADGPASNVIDAGGLVEFIAWNGGAIDVGVSGSGLRAEATFDARDLHFSSPGGNVRIAADSSLAVRHWGPTSLPVGLPFPTPTENVAANLELYGDGISAADFASGPAPIRVAQDATFVSTAGVFIRGSLSVGDLATFVATGIDATYAAGRVRYSAPAGVVRLVEGDSTIVADWATDSAAPNVPTPTPTVNASRTLEVRSAGSIEDAATAKISVTEGALFVATQDIRFANEGAANSLVVGGLATFVSGAGAARRIEVGVNAGGGPADATFTAESYRFASPEGTVWISEDDPTIVANWSSPPALPAPVPTANVAGSAALRSTASVNDADGARIRIDRDLTVVAGTSIDLADSSTNELNVGATATFISGSGSPIEVGVIDFGIPSGGFFSAGSIRFSGVGESAAGAVRVIESSGTDFAGWTGAVIPILGADPVPNASRAASLELNSDGPITDAPDARVLVTSDALFSVTLEGAIVATDPTVIVLANDDATGTPNTLSVGGVATFVVDLPDDAINPKGIDVGVNGAGAPARAVFNAGSLSFSTPGAVAIAEDSPTEIDDNIARNFAGDLELRASGAITDAPNAVVSVVDDATLVAFQLNLVNGGEMNRFEVGDLATFYAATPRRELAFNTIGVDPSGAPGLGTFNADELRFFFNVDAAIAEDSPTVLASWAGADIPIFGSTPEPANNSAPSFELRSAGSITDTADADTRVGVATLIAASEIVLADGAAVNRFESTGAATFIVGSGQKIDLGVTSTGGVAPAFFNVGSLRFSAPGGDARIAEDSGSDLASWQGANLPLLGATPEPIASEAATLNLVAAGRITDAPSAQITVTGDASFIVVPGTNIAEPTAIVLADDNVAGSVNRLQVGGLARFVVDPAVTLAGRGIDVGVVPATGAPANAHFDAGSLSFSAPGGTVRIAEDSGTILGAAASSADGLELTSDGDITDEAAADVAIASFALLSADGGDGNVFLGDGDAKFGMGAPELFSPNDFLAIDAHDVSIHADTPVNLRTSAGTLKNLTSTSDFSGVFFLDAVGSVSQFTDAAPTALSAERVSIASQTGVVLLRLVQLRAAGDKPNLQVHAGGDVELDFATAGVTVESRFETGVIPSAANPKFVPVRVEGEVSGEGRVAVPRDGDPGVEDLLLADGKNAQLFETLDAGAPSFPGDPSAAALVGEAYGAVVVVTGNAVIGDVADPIPVLGDPGSADPNSSHTADTEAARGFVVAGTGNGFLRTLDRGDLLFTNLEREGGDDSQATVVQMAGGVFTAVAAGALRIDTESPDQQAAVHRTTKLSSRTGTVTSVAALDGESSFGPRGVLDPSTEEPNAATSGLVRASSDPASDFEQRVTLTVGSRGEDNVLIEVEWADVARTRDASAANPRFADSLGRPVNTVPEGLIGSRPLADLVQAPVAAVQDLSSDPGMTGLEYVELANQFRVVTLSHNYSREFLPVNPAQDTLPTTIRVYNDPSINLYEGFREGGQLRDLNSAEFVVAPRVISTPTEGLFILSAPEPPRVYEPVTLTVPAVEVSETPQQNAADLGAAAVASSAEEVKYGRIDEATGKFLMGIPGEPWPRVREDAEGDFLREIREAIDEGPYSDGVYQIKIVTPRSEQVLEEWVKGPEAGAEAQDANAAGTAEQPAERAAAAEKGAEAVPVELAPEEAPVEPTPAPAAKAPDGPLGAVGMSALSIAAVGAWRRRFDRGGPATLSADGVTFTRLRRRRRTLEARAPE